MAVTPPTIREATADDSDAVLELWSQARSETASTPDTPMRSRPGTRPRPV